ncbi:I78 family peptidase inhibitor [Methylocystis sp. ATCC 49242]|uniref:I78 family peptidase inhibitor n=1 Tax=Methylocystis sp. ATCC 49242 TaxID=622637 RepID=UPI0001F8718F|nr:I78 family peptidase inhibitor [Methylocystis sp. ATCC 49242]
MRAWSVAASLAAPFSLIFAAPAAALDLSTCEAEGLERFIGKPVKELQRIRTIDVRYVCSTCPATMDFSAQRLTVVYDRSTGRITELSCN